MTRNIMLRPFADLVHSFKSFHEGKTFTSPAMDEADLFLKNLAAVTDVPSIENIKLFLKAVKTPFLQGVHRKEQLILARDTRAQAMSHLCLAEKPDHFQQYEDIVSDTNPCNDHDVIFWADELMIVTKIDVKRGKASTLTFKDQKSYYKSFGFGMEGEPHYVLGHYTV